MARRDINKGKLVVSGSKELFAAAGDHAKSEQSNTSLTKKIYIGEMQATSLGFCAKLNADTFFDG